MASSVHELVDIVDVDDQVIATVARREMRAYKLRHRMVGILVRSSSGSVLVHQRAADKDVWPSMWDVMVGGVVAAGESYEWAARRELNEEIGVDAPLRFVLGGAFDNDDVHEIARVFVAVHDGPFEFSDHEVVAAFFVANGDISEFIASHDVVPDSLYLLGLLGIVAAG